MRLTQPPEPVELKAWMLSLKHSHFEDSSKKGIDWDSFVVWSGNKLPKYLWDHWKTQLKPLGLTWQKFMRILRHRTDIGVLWYKGSLPWNEFVSSLTNLLNDMGEEKTTKSIEKNSKPIDLAQWQIPPLSDWEKFERLCLDLWKEIWNDPNAQRFGSSGQRQGGIDILGTLNSSGGNVGVQCKKKDVMYASETLEAKDVKEIAEEAKKCNPPLSELTIAYIGKRDAKLQAEAKRITQEYKAVGFFSVHIFSWDDILEVLGNYSHVFRKHFPEFAGNNIDLAELNKHIESPVQIKNGTTRTKPGISTKKVAREIANTVADTIAVSGEHDAEIDHARDLIHELKYKESLDYLEKLEKRIWNNADKKRRFRILTNKAVCLHSLGKADEAGKLFIEAFQYNPEDEKSLANRALGHFLLNQISEAREYSQKVLDKNPVSTRAYSLLINCASSSDSMEQILQNIPVNLRKKEDVSFALAYATRERGDLEGAAQWIRISLEDAENNGKKRNPDTVGALATTILETFMKRTEILNGIQLTPDNKEKIQETINLFSEAINSLSSDTLPFRVSWLANRSTAYRLIGEFDLAVADMEHVIRLEQNNPAMIKQYAFMIYATGNHKKAIELLRSVLGKSEVPEASLVLAGILHENGQHEEAKNILESALTKDLEATLKAEMRRLLIHVYMKMGDPTKAREISSESRGLEPTNIENLVIAARIEKQGGNINEATQLIDEARRYVNEDVPPHHIVELSDELFALEKYPDAWPLYEKIVDPMANNYLVNNLLYSYYRSGETEKAIAFAKRISPENKTSFIIKIELSVFEDVNDLNSAINTAEKYLETHPEDLETRINLATLWFRTDQFDKLDTFLDSEINVVKTTLNAGFQFAGLCHERGRDEKALRLAYELRREHFDNGEAHQKYIGAFFGTETNVQALLDPTKDARLDMAVCVTNDINQKMWHIIEDRKDVKTVFGEVAIDSSLGKKLIGKKVGDEVVTSEGSIEKVVVKVAEIKSKYVHALHESMNILPERFGDLKGLERVTFRSGTAEETKESVQKILGTIEKHDNFIREAEKFYGDSKLTVGAFAKLIGRNIIEVWNGLSASKWGIKTCVGTLEERKKAFDLLKVSKTVAMDITSLLTAERLKILELIEKRFEKIFITQSTKDIILEVISDRKGMSSRGYMNISKDVDQFVRQEVSSKDVKAHIDYLEKLKKWINDHCEIVPLKRGSKPGDKKDLREILGPSFYETLQMAQEQGVAIYTDDFGTRMLAQNDFKVEGFWTQIILISALENKDISSDEYNEAVTNLIHLHYRHITINSQTILYAAKKSDWTNTGVFKEVLDTLRGTQMELQSVMGVLVDFLFYLWQEPVFDLQRDDLTMAILDVLVDKRDDRHVIKLMRAMVEIRFKLTPLAERRLQQVISAWESLRIRI